MQPLSIVRIRIELSRAVACQSDVCHDGSHHVDQAHRDLIQYSESHVTNILTVYDVFIWLTGAHILWSTSSFRVRCDCNLRALRVLLGSEDRATLGCFGSMF